MGSWFRRREINLLNKAPSLASILFLSHVATGKGEGGRAEGKREEKKSRF